MKIMLPRRFGITFALLGASLLAAAPVGAADVKIGLVDFPKVMGGYYKTKQAEARLKERGGEAEKVHKGMLEDYQKATEEYKKLIDSSNDQAVSSEERDKRRKSAETKLLEVQEIERSINQFRTQTKTSIEEQKRRVQEDLIRALREVITAQAKKGGYTMVLDSSSILYNNGQNDLTEEILTEVNASAPPEGAAPAAAEKPDGKATAEGADSKKK